MSAPVDHVEPLSIRQDYFLAFFPNKVLVVW